MKKMNDWQKAEYEYERQVYGDDLEDFGKQEQAIERIASSEVKAGKVVQHSLKATAKGNSQELPTA